MACLIEPLMVRDAIAVAAICATLLAGVPERSAGLDSTHPAVARALANIAAFPARFAASRDDEFIVRRLIVDADGDEHVRFDRRHKGLPVVGGDIIVHDDATGRLDGVSLTLPAPIAVETEPVVTSVQAIATAAAVFVGERTGDPTAQLVVYARGAVTRLAFEVELDGVRPDGTPSELHVFVDAAVGSVLDAWDRIETTAPTQSVAPPVCVGDCDGSGSVTVNELVLGVNIALDSAAVASCPAFDCERDGSVEINCLVQGVDNALAGCTDASPTAMPTTAVVTPTATPTGVGVGHGFFYDPVPLTTTLSSGLYELSDSSRGGQNTTDMNNGGNGDGTLFTDSDDLWGDGTQASRQSVGVDAQYGMAETWDYYAAVHGRMGIADDGTGAFNRVHYRRRYDNAFWSDDCFCMTYGDGDGVTYYPFVALDVIGHEMTHGVTSHTAALVYSGESGGLNESTSDMFGTAVEFYADNPDDPPDYDIGEKLAVDATALRYMYRPSKDGSSADCWSSNVGSLDVHYSSGVGNHFFYLLAEGSGVSGYTDDVGATTCDGSTLTGIGRLAAEQIWYRALTVYITAMTDYAGARRASLDAATDLYGADSDEQRAVAAAWSAVNVH